MEALKVEDHGEWLSFGISHAGQAIPVKISREVMQEFFGAAPGDSLKKAYELDAEMIHARAADLVVVGTNYTPDNPLVLRMEDF
ncbi:hypothetical protein [Polaromonas sp. JS666]|uniref:hypothetical protein n=1 Tax=Polaromonas sp. (strain JS666 / ATCC BAA-500) TaxID=296591 RepID=UPI000882194B|nr:hypothetical protein [Polaromonas sp. JS666]SDN12484.1 hypothetical protein SAMN05720382_103471 [Polaromonas sp. JS666]